MSPTAATTDQPTLARRSHRALSAADLRKNFASHRGDIPFITKRGRGQGGGFNYWDVSGIAAGSYSEDCATGRALAKTYLDQKPWNVGAASDLGNIVIGMIENGATDRKGLVIGFMAAVSERLSVVRLALDHAAKEVIDADKAAA